MGTDGQRAEARVHSRSGGFTIIDNGIFKDRALSLKAKGLLCTVLSLPPEWDYSIRGLLKIINPSQNGKLKPSQGQGRDGLYSTLNELEEHGYLVREQTRNEDGKLGKLLYHFYDSPQSHGSHVGAADPTPVNPQANCRTEPHTENPDTAGPHTENPPQLITKRNKGLTEINHPSSSAQSRAHEEGRRDDAFDQCVAMHCSEWLQVVL